jgi:hypothetical protein
MFSMAVNNCTEWKKPTFFLIILFLTMLTEIPAKSIAIIVGAGLDARYIFRIRATDRLVVALITGTSR